MKQFRPTSPVALLPFTLILAALSATAAPSHPKDNHPAPEPIRQYAPDSVTPDPLMSRAWHLDAIGAKKVWAMTKGSPNTLIAIVDSGLDYNNPEIAANIRWNDGETPNAEYADDVIGWDIVRNNNRPYDRAGHGTFLAVIIAGLEGNGIGASGVCPKCNILPVRFLNWEGLGDTEDAISGLNYAVSRGAKIINFSFSGEGYDADLKAAIQNAGDHDALVVAAASNDGLDDDHQDIYPAKFDLPNLITIAATTRDDNLWEDSNWGHRTVHIGVPGDDILSLWLGNYDVGSGTSDAAAVASGAAGLLRSAAPSLTAVQIKQIMMATARPVGRLKAKLVTGGILDIAAAVSCATDVNLPCLDRSAHRR